MNAEKFWAHTEPELNTGCLLWWGGCHDAGYGRVQFEKRVQPAHRVAWKLTRGDIPQGLVVCHRCDTPACVNPQHLFLGTHRDNAQDKVRKGRHRFRVLSGADHPRIGTTLEQAQFVLNRHAAGETAASIARSLGIAVWVARNVIHGRSWRNTPIKDHSAQQGTLAGQQPAGGCAR